MNYYELSFTYTSPIEKEIINDVLAAELGEIGFESFTESEKGLLGYISEALYDKKTLDDKLADFPLENTRIDYTSKYNAIDFLSFPAFESKGVIVDRTAAVSTDIEGLAVFFYFLHDFLGT